MEAGVQGFGIRDWGLGINAIVIPDAEPGLAGNKEMQRSAQCFFAK